MVTHTGDPSIWKDRRDESLKPVRSCVKTAATTKRPPPPQSGSSNQKARGGGVERSTTERLPSPGPPRLHLEELADSGSSLLGRLPPRPANGRMAMAKAPS